MQKFVALAHKDFVSEVAAEGAKKGKSKARVKK
jgi:hypothetical protein